MKKIHILVENLSIKRGSERIACLLMNELSSRYEIYCISLRGDKEKLAYFLDSKINIYFLSSSLKRIRYSFIFWIYKYLFYIFKYKPKIILNVGLSPILISVFAKFVFLNVKIISWEHTALKNAFSNKIKEKIRKIALVFSNKIVVLTKKDKENYQKKYINYQKKIKYIYNFIDENLLELNKIYDIKSKKIITVGSFDKVKGYDRLVKIAKKVLEKNKDWEWHIYGDGEEFENINFLIKENQLEEKLILKGKVDNIYELYKEYSFYVMTSYYEGLPMVLLEAKANNLPLVSFDIETGPSEIIRNGVDGYLIENNNLEQMIEKIDYLIKNENVRKKFSDKSKENLDKFEKNKIINQWIELIENI